MLGMLIGIVITIFSEGFNLHHSYTALWIVLPFIVGGSFGFVLAHRVEMEQMPEMVALLHSFVGLAAVLVGYAEYYTNAATLGESMGHIAHLIETFVGVAIGAVTWAGRFTLSFLVRSSPSPFSASSGSIVAFAKLHQLVSGDPCLLPGRHLINFCLVGGTIYLCFPFCQAEDHDGGLYLGLCTCIAACFCFLIFFNLCCFHLI